MKDKQHLLNDAETNFVYISDRLKVFYRDTYRRLTKLFDEMEIEWGEVEDTKDIWIRDYMPLQISQDKFLVYDYAPDYLMGKYRRYQTDSHTVFNGIIPTFKLHDINMKLDGGNFVPCQDCVVMTDKVFTENGYPKYDAGFSQYIQENIGADVIFIPWHCINPEDPDADVYGHSDGIVHWTGGNHVLMSNHRDTNPNEAAEIRRRLEESGLKVTEMLFDVPNPNADFNWAYINYLQVGNKIIVPVFGIPEDKQALNYIRDANPDCIIRTFRMRDVASKGGALHCITWNIKK